MDGQHSEEMLKHLEKQSEILMETYRLLSHDLHRLQVEEEMLTRKLHEVISAESASTKDGHIESSRSIDNKGEEASTEAASQYKQ